MRIFSLAALFFSCSFVSAQTQEKEAPQPGAPAKIVAEKKVVSDITRIVFASCCHQSKPAPILKAIRSYQPQLYIWMGDNIYGDSPNAAVLREKYALQLQRPEYRAIRDLCPVIGTWDDHDFGANDAGKNYPNREASQQAFLDFIGEPKDTIRRKQQGVYTFYDYGTAGKKIRVILLDTRYFRDDIGSNGDILGEDQWQWLNDTLTSSDANLNLLVSSIQVIPEEQRFEKWANFGKARKRLLELLARPSSPAVIVLSGDRHLAEISQLPAKVIGYPLTEITSSALTQSKGGNPNEINQYRLGENYGYNNFGSISIDWGRTLPIVTVCVNNEQGTPIRAITTTAPKKPAQSK